MSEPIVISNPVGTVRRHHEMVAVKQPLGYWLIVYPDTEPTLTAQRLEDIGDKWPLEYTPGDDVAALA